MGKSLTEIKLKCKYTPFVAVIVKPFFSDFAVYYFKQVKDRRMLWRLTAHIGRQSRPNFKKFENDYVCVVIGVCEIGGKNGKYEEIFILDAPGYDRRNRKSVAFFV